VAVTELGAGSQKIDPAEAATAIYHYTKFSFTLGWHSNIFALFKGHFLENREAALRHQRDQMLAEVSKRQARIAELESLVKQYEAQNLLELEQRREAAQAELKAESEALHRLEERLKRIETETGTPQAPPQTPPPSAPHR
jgi:multidrug efflux pump subunit AcrA (membrane-fusion protein)